MASLTIHQAVLILYKGQSNVQQMATRIGVSLETMKKALNEYVAATPLDEDDWLGDVNPSWPWAN